MTIARVADRRVRDLVHVWEGSSSLMPMYAYVIFLLFKLCFGIRLHMLHDVQTQHRQTCSRRTCMHTRNIATSTVFFQFFFFA